MDNLTLKSVAFGGFDKQDVVTYIEKTAQVHKTLTDELERSLAAARDDAAKLQTQCDELTERCAQQAQQLEELQAQLESALAEKEALQASTAQVESLSAEIAALRPDAEAYRRFRDRIGDIECEARTRAAETEQSTAARMAELEAATRAGLQKTTAEFREKYQAMAAAMNSASGYINTELRKMEVNLTQMPLALNQVGTDLSELEKLLKSE